MKTLIFFILGLFTSVIVNAQISANLDEEKGYSNFKLGKYYLDYRVNLTPLGTVKNEKVYIYSTPNKQYFAEVPFDEILLWFDVNDRLSRISFSKLYTRESADKCLDTYIKVVKYCKEIYSLQPTKKEYEENDSHTYEMTFLGNIIRLEVFSTIYKEKSKGEELSVYFSFK